VSDFARELVGGVLTNKDRIDNIIQTHAPAWPVAQLATIDRNILRLAIFEILLNNKVPVKAAINEAVELAKTFGSENSPKFINGVLGTVSAGLSRERG
jgi:N utilization substance protein B